MGNKIMFWILASVGIAIALELLYRAFLFIFARPRILKWVGSWFTKFTIHAPDRSDYLTRYYILKNNWMPFRIYLHQFHRSDGDRDCHCHPFDFLSVILYSGYCETRPGYRDRNYYQGDILFRRGPDLHSVALFPECLGKEREAWTLVFTSKKYREWGFMTENGWMHHREYFDIKFGKGNWSDADDPMLQITKE